MSCVKNGQFIKKSLLDRLDAGESTAVQRIVEKLEAGLIINKTDLKPLQNYTALQSKDVEFITKLTRKTLNDLAANQPNIKNSDGTYNILEIFSYYRYNNGLVDSREEKTQVEVEILKEKLANIQNLYMLKTEIELIFSDRMQRLLNSLDTLKSNQSLLKLENKSIAELRKPVDDIINNLLQIYRNE